MKRLTSFTILGDPVAQKRHRHAKVGNFVRTYDPSTKEKTDFRIVAQQNAPATPFKDALFVEINCYFARAKSHFGTGRNAGVLKASAPAHHTKKPDGDNLVKFIFDALNGIFWTDDSIITGHSINKHYSDRPRTEVVVYGLEDSE